MGFTATFYPEGRVDAILLQCGEHYAFVDGGYRKNGLRLIKRLKQIGINKIDCYIATHRHRNHIGGAAAIIEALKPDIVYSCHPDMRAAVCARAGNKAERAAAEADEYRCLGRGEVFNLGGAVFTRIGPISIKKCGMGSMAENQNSLILRCCYKNQTLLLTGDTSATALNACYNAGYPVYAQLLKNPHHGGKLPVSVLRAIKPEVVVVCNSAKASAAYVKRVHGVGADIYSACKGGDGTVEAWSFGAGWEIGKTRKDGKITWES